MKRCMHSGIICAFSVGMAAGIILPECWIVTAAAILLVVMAFSTRRCFRRC